MSEEQKKDKNLSSESVKTSDGKDLREQDVGDIQSVRSKGEQIESVETANPPLEEVYASIIKFLSIPERTVRSSLAITGGVIKESANFLIPQTFRSAKLYQVLVEQTLNFVVNEVGSVEPTDEEKERAIDNFVARRTVGHLVETVSIVALHVSPLWILAVVSDVAHGSKVYLQELTVELKAVGLIADESSIDDVDGLLEVLSSVSGTAAKAVHVPPLTMRCLKKNVTDMRKALKHAAPSEIISLKEIEGLWNEIKSTSQKENMSMLGVAGAMLMGTGNHIINVGKGALAGTKVTLTLFDRYIIDHYQNSLTHIRKKGIFTSLQETSGPYVTAVWENFNFDSTRETLTHKIMSGQILTNVWTKIKSLFSGKSAAK